MPCSYDLKLESDRVPKWPHICVRCERAAPESVFAFHAESEWLPLALLSGSALGKKPKVYARACESCAKAMKQGRWIRFIVLWVTSAILVFLTFELYKISGLNLQGYWKTLAIMGACFSFFVPLYAVACRFPPPISAAVDGKHVEYAFRSRQVFILFSAANNMLTIGMTNKLAPDLVIAPELPEELELLQSKKSASSAS
jgi:hypothetical protein